MASAGEIGWLRDVAERGTDLASTVQQLLHAVRLHLGMEVAWTTDFVGTDQVFRCVDAETGASAPAVGSSLPLSGSFCARVVDGRAPALIPDARQEPAVALLDVTRELEIGAYIGVPLVGPLGTVTGMLCATSRSALPVLSDRELQTLRLLAQLLRDLQMRELDEVALRTAREQLVRDVERVIRGEDRTVVLQPIVDARSGVLVAVEGLSRFASERTPAQWFEAAARAGLRTELELAAARSILELVRSGAVPPDAAVCINLSPACVVTADLGALLADVDPARIVIEVTEHQQVDDYARLVEVLAPWRRRGLRLAVDDAGAGYASLQHVLMCAPDLLKLDMALVRGVDGDPVRKALVSAVMTFARDIGIGVIAEGVETEAERAALVALGVPMLQAFLIRAGDPA
jgi:EAL domain-containing protein (putative c-di-GMP-specific phosphodiesterase class I)